VAQASPAPLEASPVPVEGDGVAAAPEPVPAARRTGTARRGRHAAPEDVAPAAPEVEEPVSSGTGPELSVKGLDDPHRSDQLNYSAPGLDASPRESGRVKAAKSATVTGTKEPARNAPCPCGSGKKYKVCHGAPSRA
jgi:preprotein translocase subunit SecA